MSNGLDKAARLAEKREKEARKAAEIPALAPPFPWKVRAFSPSFFELPANPEKEK